MKGHLAAKDGVGSGLDVPAEKVVQRPQLNARPHCNNDTAGPRVAPIKAYKNARLVLLAKRHGRHIQMCEKVVIDSRQLR